MLSIERRRAILEELHKNKKVIVGELSRRFDVSEETIRRDLEKLCKEGHATKTYGGAVLNEDTNIDLPFIVRKNRNIEAKQAMAKIVDTLIEDGDHIVLDASSTAVFIAKAIKHKKDMTVITNSVEILIELSDIPSWDVISTGGSLKRGYLALFGAGALAGLQQYNAGKLFFSCKGLDMEKGITDGNIEFSQIKQAMLSSVRTNCLVVGSTKFDCVGFSKIVELDAIDMIVTDQAPSAKWLEFLADRNIECLF